MILYCVFQNSCRGHTIHTFIRILVHAIWRFIVRCQGWFLFWFELFIYVLLYIYLFVLHEVICRSTWNGIFLSGLPGHIPIVWHGRRVVCRGLVCVVRPTAQPPISMVYRILMVVKNLKLKGGPSHQKDITQKFWGIYEITAKWCEKCIVIVFLSDWWYVIFFPRYLYSRRKGGARRSRSRSRERRRRSRSRERRREPPRNSRSGRYWPPPPTTDLYRPLPST